MGTVRVGKSKALARPGAASAAPRRAMRRESTGPSLTMHTLVVDEREEAARARRRQDCLSVRAELWVWFGLRHLESAGERAWLRVG